MFFRILIRSFWALYDNLFKCVLMNMMLFLVSFGVFAFFFFYMKNGYLAAAAVLLVWHVVSPVYIYYFGKLARVQEHGGMWAEMGGGFKLFALRGLAVFVINAAAICVFLIAINFYRANANMKIPMLVLGGLGIWAIIVFFIMQLYVIPIMVLDEKRRVFISYKKALLMTMSSPFASSTTAFFIGYFLLLLYPVAGFAFGAHIPTLLALFALFPIFLMPFLSFVYIMMIQVNAAVLGYEKHNIYPPLKEYWEERKLGNLFKPWDNNR